MGVNIDMCVYDDAEDAVDDMGFDSDGLIE